HADEGDLDGRAGAFDGGEDVGEAEAFGEGVGVGGLDGGPVGDGVGEGEAEFDEGGAGGFEFGEDGEGGVEVGGAGGDEGHEGHVLAGTQVGEGVADRGCRGGGRCHGRGDCRE